MSISSQSPNPYANSHAPYATSRSSFNVGDGSSGGRLSRILKRLFKFPQMDFEVATWEMTSLIFAPKKVFRNVYYRVCSSDVFFFSSVNGKWLTMVV